MGTTGSIYFLFKDQFNIGVIWAPNENKKFILREKKALFKTVESQHPGESNCSDFLCASWLPRISQPAMVKP